MHNSQIEKRGTIFCPTTVFALQPFLLQGSKLSTELTESTCRLPKSGSNRIQNSCVNWPTKWWFERGGSFHLHRPCVAFSFTTFWMSLEVQSLNKAIWQFYISETFCCLCTTIFCAQTTIQPAARIDRLSIFVNYSAVCALQSFVHKPRFNQLHDLTGWVDFENVMLFVHCNLLCTNHDSTSCTNWQVEYICKLFCRLCTAIFCAQTTIQPAARFDRLSIFRKIFCCLCTAIFCAQTTIQPAAHFAAANVVISLQQAQVAGSFFCVCVCVCSNMLPWYGTPLSQILLWCTARNSVVCEVIFS